MPGKHSHSAILVHYCRDKYIRENTLADKRNYVDYLLVGFPESTRYRHGQMALWISNTSGVCASRHDLVTWNFCQDQRYWNVAGMWYSGSKSRKWKMKFWSWFRHPRDDRQGYGLPTTNHVKKAIYTRFGQEGRIFAKKIILKYYLRYTLLKTKAKPVYYFMYHDSSRCQITDALKVHPGQWLSKIELSLDIRYDFQVLGQLLPKIAETWLVF